MHPVDRTLLVTVALQSVVCNNSDPRSAHAAMQVLASASRPQPRDPRASPPLRVGPWPSGAGTLKASCAAHTVARRGVTTPAPTAICLCACVCVCAWIDGSRRKHGASARRACARTEAAARARGAAAAAVGAALRELQIHARRHADGARGTHRGARAGRVRGRTARWRGLAPARVGPVAAAAWSLGRIAPLVVKRHGAESLD